MEAMTAAKKYGTVISYDLNYRTSLWSAIGGQEKAIAVNRAIAPLVDVMIGNEEDFSAALGFAVPGLDKHYSKPEPARFKTMIGEAIKVFGNFKAVATTLRHAKTATQNDWGAILYAGGQFYDAALREDLDILDRVGGGDSFASGLIYALLEAKPPQEAVDYGLVHKIVSHHSEIK